MKVILKTEVGKSITLNINPKDTFRDIKTRMVNKDGVPLDLWVNGMEVTDDQNVLDFFSAQQANTVDSEAEEEFEEAEVEKPAASEVFCSIRDCNNSKATHPNKAFFRFPTREDRRHHWLLVGRREDLLFAPPGSFRTQYAVCSDHFSADQFETPRELKNEATPNLLLPREEVLSIKEEPCNAAYDEEDEEEVVPSDLEDTDQVERSGRLCRLCATASEEMVYIFSAAGIELNLEQLINSTLPISIRRNDNLPKQLCMSCLSRLHAANALAEECLQAEEQLSLLMQLNFFRSPEDPDEVEELGDPGDDANVCCPLCKEGGLCKVAPEDLVEEVDPTPQVPDSNSPRGCKLCGQLFRGRDEGLEHAATHATPECRPCPLCETPVTTEDELIAHFDEAHFDSTLTDSNSQPRSSESLLRCTCGQTFEDEDGLYSHCCFSRELTRYVCRQCSTSFVSAARLEFHSCCQTGSSKQRTCLRCQRTFSCESSLYFHWRMAHDRERRDEEAATGQNTARRKVELQCHACGLRCSRRAELREHVAREHPGASAKRVPSLINYHCRECQKTFTTSHQVVNHRVAHLQASEGHACEYCPLQFDSVKTLSLHQKRAHADERPYLCAVCSHTSRTLYEARSHRKSHMDALDWREMSSCPEDGGSLARRVVSAARRRAHHECEFCGKRFADSQRLAVHRRLHTGEKPFGCTACGKRFAQSSALHTHSLLHSGVKPHSCDLCGKAFRIKADRDNHRRTHTGEKPFKCEYCAKAFRTGQVYYQHRMIHTGERRFPCDICGLAFKRSHTLVVHKRIHTGEKPNVCDICNKGFRQRTDMRKHRLLHGAHVAAASALMPAQDEEILS